MARSDPKLLHGIVCSLTDSVMALAPRGWAELELSFVATPRGLKLSELEAKGGGKEPRPLPCLGLSPKLEAERLSQGCTELWRLLGEAGRTWPGGKIVLRRGAGALDWVLQDGQGAQAYFTRLDQATVDSLLVTDALFEAVGGTERAFAALQSALERRLGETVGHGFDPQTAQATLLREGVPPAVVRAEVVGFYDPESFTWQWAWANQTVPPKACEAVHRVCAPEARQPGLSAFWRGQYHCDEAFAWALAGHVAVAIGARGLFRAGLQGQESAMLLALGSDVPARP